MRGTGSRALVTLAAVSLLTASLLPNPALGDVDKNEDLSGSTTTGGGGPTQCEEGSTIPNCDPGIYTWVWVSGIVTDAYGDPLQGATVSSPSDYDTTGPLGEYTVEVKTNDEVRLTAYKTGYVTRSKLVDPYEASLTGVNFTLPFKLSVTVTPDIFASVPQDVDLAVTTTAPTLGSEVWVDMPDGTQLSLSPDPSNPGRWTASTSVGSTTAEGRHYIRACAVDSGSSGTCSSVTGLRLTDVELDIFTFDETPPLLDGASPLPSTNTLDASMPINIMASDSLSGVDASSLALELDGTEVASGSLSYQPASNLSLGLHTATATASDLAGNQSIYTWQFNVTDIQASPAHGRLATQTVDVNPDGDLIDPPTQVTFYDVEVSLDAYEIDLSPVAFEGYSPISRSVDLSGAEVIFTNETGVTSDPVNAGLGSVSFQGRLGIIWPEVSQTVVGIDRAAIVLPEVTVEVPTGYNTGGSVGRLQMPDVPTGPVFSAHHPYLGRSEIPDGPLLMTAAITEAVSISSEDGTVSPISAGVAVSPGWRTGFRVGVVSDLLPAALQIPVAVLQNLPGSSDSKRFFDAPDWMCGSDTTCLVGDGPLLGSHSWLILGSGLPEPAVEIYANHWLFEESEDSAYIDWQQTSVHVPASTGCLKDFTNESLAIASPGWTKDQVALPVLEDPDVPGVFTTKLPWLTNSMYTSPSFLSSPDSHFSELDPVNGVYGSIWQLGEGTTEPGSVVNEKMATGIEYSFSSYGGTLIQAHGVGLEVGGCSA